MGFSANLQSQAAHEALLTRQDTELRLLETMRRSISNKVKCDRDYALALTTVALQGQKIDRADDLNGSLVAQTWKTMMEELESAAKLIKANADAVEKETLEKLNSLCMEKRRARKVYQEEHNRISQQFGNVSMQTTKQFILFILASL